MSIERQGRIRRLLDRIRHRIREGPPSDNLIQDVKDEIMANETCLICTDGFKAEGTALIKPCRNCSQSWCMDCILAQCLRATQSLGEMPPKCCRTFDPRLVLKALPEKDHPSFKSLFDEYRTEAKERIYCPNKQCGTFVSPYSIAKQQALQASTESKLEELKVDEADSKERHKRHDSAVTTPNTHVVDCEKCNVSICLTCKQLAHEGSPCNIEDDPVIAQIRKFGYKRCPRCGFGTRRMWGCSHMQCVCGAHWCWSCERNFNLCDALGGCEEEYDEDSDPSDVDEEIDTKEEEIVEDKVDVVELQSTPVSSEAPKDGAESGPKEGEAGPSAPTQDSTHRRRRSINLDRGSHAFWEQGGLDFGDEPSDATFDDSWGCEHQFFSRQHRNDDDLGQKLCWECWERIEDESLTCWVCNVVRCKECQKLFDKKGE